MSNERFIIDYGVLINHQNRSYRLVVQITYYDLTRVTKIFRREC